MNYSAAFATVVLSTASVTWAGSLNRDAIPATAQWVIHIDVEAMNSTKVGACLIDRLQNQEENPLNQIEAELGIKPLEDLYSLTAFGFGKPPAKGLAIEVTDEDLRIGAITRPGENAVILAVTNDAVDKVIEQLSADPEHYSQTKLAGHTVHTWSDSGGDERWHLYQRPTKAGTRRVLLFSENAEALAAAIKVLAGDAASLSDNEDAGDMVSPRAGSIVFAAASDIGKMVGDNGGASALLQQTDKIAVEISEQEGQVNLTVSVRAKSADLATTITQVVQGAIAMATLAMDPDAEETASITALARALKFSSDDRRISLEIEQPAEVVCQLLEMAIQGAEFGADTDDD